MGRDVCLQQLVFLQKVVDRGQVLPIILRGEEGIDLREKRKG